MKIGIYDPYLDTMSGGEKYMLSAAQVLTKNHHVTLFWDLSEKDVIVKKAKERFDMDLTNLIFANPLFGKSTSTASRYMQSKKFDAIFLLSDGSIPVIASKLFIHFQSPMEWVKVSPIERVKIKRIKKVICNSEFTKHYIDKKFHIHSVVIAPPVVVQKKYSESKKANSILHVGRFAVTSNGSSYKKQEVLADLFSDMVRSGLKGWRLVFIMGVMEKDVPLCKEFQDKYKELPIEFVINPPNKKLWEEYEGAKIYWHASGFGEDLKTHPDRAEHFGISTVEAMGAGAVPVVFSAGGQKEIVTNGKNGFFWENEDELKRITLDLIEDSEKRMSIGREASESADMYSLEIFDQKISALFS